jgi:hypothetical protein
VTYKYFGDDTHHPYEFKTCPTCKTAKWIQVRRIYCSRSCSRQGEINPGWKGADAGYLALHGRIYRALGSANSCPWGHERPYEWAHQLGGQGNTDEYVSMCASCHRKFDAAIRMSFPHLCGKGLHLLTTNADYYVRVKNGKEVRQCKQCGKDRAKKHRKGGQ